MTDKDLPLFLCIAAINAVSCFLNTSQIIQTHLGTSQTCVPGFPLKIVTSYKTQIFSAPPATSCPSLSQINACASFVLHQPLLTVLQKSILLYHMLRNACQQPYFSFKLP